jgi:phytoene dehydrogenase-like protein
VARVEFDAVVVGAGPNGLAAAVRLAQEGLSVRVYEKAETVGGACRSTEVTLPGFVHDTGSAVHPLAAASPFLRQLPLERYGLEWVYSPAFLAHPLDNSPAVVARGAVEETAEQLDSDGAAYRRLFKYLVRDWSAVEDSLLGPLRMPRHPVAMARFGLTGLTSANRLARSWFAKPPARALFAGNAAHSMLPLEMLPTAAIGLVLLVAGHAKGWPFPKGGAQAIPDAMAGYLRSMGGEIVTGLPIGNIGELPAARAVLLDVTPRQLLALATGYLPPAYAARLRNYRYGMGAFKMDWALDGPIPWRDPRCAQACTVHLGGTLPEIAASERAAWNGDPPQSPFVLLAQPSLFDSSRAPEGKHTVWAYCHVPFGSKEPMEDRIEEQIERFAPGFRSRVLARHVMDPAALEAYNPNLVGGDINGGAQTLSQLFTRPTIETYSIPAKGLFLCSASTPPGGGVHGMCGYHAANAAIRYIRRGGRA